MNKTGGIPSRFKAAVKRLDGNEDLLKEMAAITIEDLPDIRSKVDQQVKAGDCDDAAKTLHKLKGMLSTFESDGVTLELQEMIQSARKGDSAELVRSYRDNEQSISELVAQIADLAADSNAQADRETN